MCDEQVEAREFLAGMQRDRAELRLARERGEAHPAQEHVEAHLDLREEWLRREVARPASRRLPKDASPPREVLSCAMNLIYVQRPPVAANGYGLQIVRYITTEEGGRRMALGFSLTCFHAGERGDPVQAATLPWKKFMGSCRRRIGPS